MAQNQTRCISIQKLKNKKYQAKETKMKWTKSMNIKALSRPCLYLPVLILWASSLTIMFSMLGRKYPKSNAFKKQSENKEQVIHHRKGRRSQLWVWNFKIWRNESEPLKQREQVHWPKLASRILFLLQLKLLRKMTTCPAQLLKL